MLVQSIDNACQFRELFHGEYRNHFSYEGFEALYNYLEDAFDGQTYEVDAVALCCEFTEDTIENIIYNYNLDENLTKEDVIDYLDETTSVVAVLSDNSIVYGVF
jgi:hypothetical protein